MTSGKPCREMTTRASPWPTLYGTRHEPSKQPASQPPGSFNSTALLNLGVARTGGRELKFGDPRAVLGNPFVITMAPIPGVCKSTRSRAVSPPCSSSGVSRATLPAAGRGRGERGHPEGGRRRQRKLPVPSPRPTPRRSRTAAPGEAFLRPRWSERRWERTAPQRASSLRAYRRVSVRWRSWRRAPLVREEQNRAAPRCPAAPWSGAMHVGGECGRPRR